MMDRIEAGRLITSQVVVTREDVARAKDEILKTRSGRTLVEADRWAGEAPKQVDLEAADIAGALRDVARVASLHLAFCQAAWELASVCEIAPVGTDHWRLSTGYRSSRGAGGLDIEVHCVCPETYFPPPLDSREAPGWDFDVLFGGADGVSVPSGIREGLSQSLECFRRGLYLPAIVMLGAACEGEWVEVGLALARALNDNKLRDKVEGLDGFGAKVAAVQKKLDTEAGRDLLSRTRVKAPRLADAELWTTVLRERRNAVHWTKAQGFIAEHSHAATLILAAPLHLATLEAVRAACGAPYATNPAKESRRLGPRERCGAG